MKLELKDFDGNTLNRVSLRYVIGGKESQEINPPGVPPIIVPPMQDSGDIKLGEVISPIFFGEPGTQQIGNQQEILF